MIFFLWKPSNHHGTQMMMFWPRYNDLCTRGLNFSLVYIQFHIIFLGITPQAQKVCIFCQAHFFLYFYQIKLATKRSLTYNLHLTFNSLNSCCKYPSAKEHDHTYIDLNTNKYELQWAAQHGGDLHFSEAFRPEKMKPSIHV